MTHQIDDSFRRRKQQADAARAGRLRRRVLTLAGGALILLALAGGGYWLHRDEGRRVAGPSATVTPTAPPALPVNAIIDLAGDPLIIRFAGGADGGGKVRGLALVDTAGGAVPANVSILSDTMLSSSRRIMPLPSRPEDFALFQSQSARGAALPTAAPAAPAPAAPDDDDVLVPVDTQNDPDAPEVAAAPEPLASGASTSADAGDETDEAAAAAAFKPTAIENTTTVHDVKPEHDRYPQIEEFTVSVKGERSLESVLADYRFDAADAKAAAAAAKSLLGSDMLADRTVAALRGLREGGRDAPLQLVQISVNSAGKYLGTLAKSDDGSFVRGADPWIDQDLSDLADSGGAPAAPGTATRLLDAIYNTATRNQVPSAVTGETIMLLSRSFDLQAAATKDDRLTIVYADDPRDIGRSVGRVLYAAIRGGVKPIECFVYQAVPGGDFSCLGDQPSTETVTVTNGMVTPVKGVLSDTFGMRMHPILGVMRMHKGVDWAAPVGTPVRAAFAGTIATAGVSESFGNVVKIAHSGGRQTTYAHLSRFEDGIAAGVAVEAGAVIGYIGSSGLSTGPHLHFELALNGIAIDPLATVVAERSGGGSQSDDAAVALLVDRIVHVESGGIARAKNPLSSATGLGQFIDSTWLRMVRTYRPELIRSMSTGDVLALRFDPVISREMVSNLARENEATLRGFGHAITAGRLYLAHFLGPQGAHLVLAADPGAILADLLGPSVIRANPFLTGKDASYVIAWAEKKMTGRAPAAVADAASGTRTVSTVPPGFAAYKEAMLKAADLGSAAAN